MNERENPLGQHLSRYRGGAVDKRSLSLPCISD